MQNSLTLILAFLCLAIAPQQAQSASTNHWTGGAGDSKWSNGANWTLGVVPDSTQSVFIDETTNAVILDTFAEAASFTLGSTQGFASLTIQSQDLLWVHGSAYAFTNSLLTLFGQFSLSGTGQLDGTIEVIGGGLNGIWPIIGPSGVMNIHDGTNGSVPAFRFENRGSIFCYATNVAAAPAYITNNSLIVLYTNTTFLLPPTEQYGTPTLYNNGIIQVPGTGAPITNYLGLMGVLANSGRIELGTNVTLDLYGTYNGPASAFLDGTVLSGGSGFQFEETFGASFNGSITLDSRLRYSYGIDGGQSRWSGTGVFEWYEGPISRFTFAPGFHVEIPDGGEYERTVNDYCTNEGTICLQATSFYLLPLYFSPGASRFVNSGTLLAPSNSGTVEFYLQCDFTNTGILKAETNAVLALAASSPAQNETFADGTVFDGAGTVQLSGYTGAVFSGTNTVNGTLDYNADAIGGSSYWTGPGIFKWRGGPINNATFGRGLKVQAISGGYKYTAGVCTNLGSVLWNDQYLQQIGGSSFYNYGQIQFDSSILVLPSDGPPYNVSIINYGLIWTAANAGTINLGFATGFTNHGTFLAGANSVIQVQGDWNTPPVAFGDGSLLWGSGKIRFLDSMDASGAPLYFQGAITTGGATIDLAGANTAGNSTWDGSGAFQWHSGTLQNITFGPRSHAQFLAGGPKILCGAMLNQGSVQLTEPCAVSSPCGAIITNVGFFQVLTNTSLDTNITVINYGDFRLAAGSLFVGSFSNLAVAELTLGSLNCSNSFVCGPGSTVSLQLIGTSPGTGFGTVSATQLLIDGALSVNSAFLFPTNGLRLTFATADSNRSGKFNAVSFFYPPPYSSNVKWHALYPSNAVALQAAPPTTLSQGTRNLDGSFQFSLGGFLGSSYEVQASTNLVDWTTIHSDLATGPLSFADTNAPAFDRRFYRLRIDE